jgi:ABC-2 type transport system ATP-binding protein
MNDSEMLVQVRNLYKQYDSLTAVDGITFDIQRGEIFGLLGPNGAGKTTTISMMAGILSPTSGEILLNGQASGRALTTRRLLGVVPQELALYNRLTARENLAFFGELYGLRGHALTARIQEMLTLVGLADRADDRAEQYSGGMKRRLNLAIGLMHSPQLLLLDEPTVGVDPQSRNHIFEGVRALNRAGLTILYTSHYMEEVQSLCDRVGILDNGKLIACGRVSELIADLGSATIEVGVPDALTAQTLLSRLQAVEHVESVEIEAASDAVLPISADGAIVSLLVRTRRPNLVLSGIVATLNAVSVPLLSLNVKQPSLESVFLALTGKTLRD